eukprot:SAG22_NODE_5663_length_975_cov_1.216895_1_plen_219_part_10
MGVFSFECEECGGHEQFDWTENAVVEFEVESARPVRPAAINLPDDVGEADLEQLSEADLRRIMDDFSLDYKAGTAAAEDRQLYAAAEAWAKASKFELKKNPAAAETFDRTAPHVAATTFPANFLRNLPAALAELEAAPAASEQEHNERLGKGDTTILPRLPPYTGLPMFGGAPTRMAAQAQTAGGAAGDAAAAAAAPPTAPASASTRVFRGPPLPPPSE